MVEKLRELGVPQYLQLWVLDYLTKRPQYVRTAYGTSSVITLNTGAPQGCVLSPVLFLLYTNSLQWNSEKVLVEKYADDTVIVGLLTDNDVNEYFRCIEFVHSWCDRNYLNLNASKTKEIVWDFRRNCDTFLPVTINNDVIDVARTYKYLGLTIDEKLNFGDHVRNILKKAQKRLYCIRALKKLNVDTAIISHFYNATMSPTLLYACIGFYGLLPLYLRRELDRPRRICSKILGTENDLNINEEMYKESLLRKGISIMKDNCHPLHEEYEMLPNGRRLRVPRIRTSRFRNTFVPQSILHINEQKK